MMPAERSDAIRAAVDLLVAALVAAVTAEAAPDAPERLLSVDEAAAMLGVGRSRLYDEIAAGRLRSLSVGRRRLVPSEGIRDYIRAGDSKRPPVPARGAAADPLPAAVPPPLNDTAAGLRTAAQAGDRPHGDSPTSGPVPGHHPGPAQRRPRRALV